MASEAQNTPSDTDSDRHPEQEEHGQSTPEGTQAAGDALQRAIAEALQPALSQMQESVTQDADAHEEGDTPVPQAEPHPATSSDDGGAPPRNESNTNPSADDTQGSNTMATDSDQTSQQNAGDQDNDGTQHTEQRASNQSARRSSSSSNPPARKSTSSSKRSGSGNARSYNPAQVARVGRLNMARAWRDQGSVYEAIKAYEEILAAYPGTGVAAAAVEDLTQMAQNLEAQGQFHAALDLYHRLEQLGVDR